MRRPPVTAREVKEANRAVYNRKEAGSYDRNVSIFHPRRQAAIEAILRDLAGRTGGTRLLDIGCSWGRWSLAAAARGYDAVGIDPSLGAIMAARTPPAPTPAWPGSCRRRSRARGHQRLR